MHKSRRPQSPSKASSKESQPSSTSLKTLAAKLPTLAPKPPSSKTSPSTSPGGSALQKSKSTCTVCLQPACRLVTHRAFGASLQAADNLSLNRLRISSRPKENTFTSSYAYNLGRQYVDRDITASRIDPFYDLPVKANFNTPEMHRLFHDWFTIDAQAYFRIPRPSEMPGDLLYSPFFMPAMQDTELCLSILAMAAAAVPARAGASPRNVVSLTLVGAAMQQMRERIDSDPEKITDITVVSVTFLWAVNAWLGDTDAMEFHGKSVYAFVHARGGLSELGMVGAVARIIRWTGILHALIFSDPCQYLDATDPTPILKSTQCRYGTFWLLARTSGAAEISVDVITACQQNCELIALLEQVESGGITAVKHMFLLDKLCFLYVNESLLRATYHETGDLNACICFALSLIKIKCCYGDGQPQLLITANAVALVKAVKAAGGPSFWQKDLDMLIWLLFIAVMLPEDFEDKTWCVELLSQAVAIKFGEDEDWPSSWREDLRDCLRSFMWSDVRFAGFFRKVCSVIARSQGMEEGEAEMEEEEETEEGEEEESDSEGEMQSHDYEKRGATKNAKTSDRGSLNKRAIK